MCRANNKIYYAMFGVKILSVILKWICFAAYGGHQRQLVRWSTAAVR